MRIVLAGFFVVALAGCPEDALDALEASGACVSEGEVGSRCTESADGSNKAKRQCDEETSEFVEDNTCAELGYTDLCMEDEDIRLFGESPEECEAFDNRSE